MSLLCRWFLAKYLQIRTHIAIDIVKQLSHSTECTAAIENYDTCIIRSSSYIMHSYTYNS